MKEVLKGTQLFQKNEEWMIERMIPTDGSPRGAKIIAEEILSGINWKCLSCISQ